MKKTFYTLMLAAISGAMFNSCGQEYQPIEPNPLDTVNRSNKMRGDFEMYTYSGSTHYIADEKTVTDASVNDVRTLVINTKEYSDSLDADVYKEMYIAIANYDGVGTYSIDGNVTVIHTVAYKAGSIIDYNQISNDPEGYINITNSADGRYEGDFQMRVKSELDTSTIMITNGKFNLEI